MGYCFELRPKSEKPLFIEELKNRFFKAGLQPHPNPSNLDLDPEIQQRYINDFLYSQGTIGIEVNEHSPSGVTAWARASLGTKESESRDILTELVGIAQAIDAELILNNQTIITTENIGAVVCHLR